MKKQDVVRAFVFNTDGDILLVRHRKDSPFALPWWHREPWESLHDAMIREIKEETGSEARFFDIDPGDLIRKWNKLKNLAHPISIYEIQITANKTNVEYIFLMEMTEDIKQIQDEEIIEYGWYEPEKILTMIPEKEIWGQYIQILSKLTDDE